ncbi:MAG TPA: YciI family protein [Candidatus Saccharimonadales bacterium]|nr:YciI family protein [Candidatus Saccharimonadales bacterium]
MSDPSAAQTAMPPDLTIESVWLVEATYAPDAAETRGPFRAEHVARIGALRAAGIYLEAGAFPDVSTSLVLLRAGSEAEALDIVRQDVYIRNGVWVELRARPFGRVARTDEVGGPAQAPSGPV